MATTTPPLYDDQQQQHGPPPNPAGAQPPDENAPPAIPYVGSPTLVYQGVNPAVTFTITFTDQHNGRVMLTNITASNRAQALALVVNNQVTQQTLAGTLAASDPWTVTITQP